MDRIIRTCSVVALLAVAWPTAGMAAASEDALRAYVRGRAAAAGDRLDEAARAYSQALSLAPTEPTLEGRAFIYALAAGDRPLAVKLAAAREERGEGTVETRLTLLADAVARGDRKKARRYRALLTPDGGFGFGLPVIDAWLAFGERRSDPLALLVAPEGDVIARAYVAEHRALMLAALGRVEEAEAAFAPLTMGRGGRAVRLRLAEAAMLAKARRRDDALAVLAGNEPEVLAARAVIAAGGVPGGGVEQAAEGLAELFARFAADIGRERAPALALSSARLATFLAPRNAEGWIIVADLLNADGKAEAAYAVLDQVAAGDPFKARALSSQVSLLLGLGRGEQALALAQRQAQAPGATASDWSRYGDVLGELKRPAESAQAYERVLTLLDKDDPGRWQAHLLLGGAYGQAGEWRRSEVELRRAVALAPQEAVALNYLGYSLLEHGGDVKEAESLIAKAHEIQPEEGSITDSLGWTAYQQGRYARAVELLERAAAAEPADGTINEHLGDAYWQVGRHLEARFAWRAALVGIEAADERTRLTRKIDWGLDQLPAAGK